MEALVKTFGDLGPGLGSLTLVGYLLITLSLRQDKKDAAYIATLATMQEVMQKIQTDVDKNWVLTQEISRAQTGIVQVLSGLKCVERHERSA